MNFFAQCIVSMFAVTILVSLSLRAHGPPTRRPSTSEHFHDLGKLQFGFLIVLGLRELLAVHAHLVREHSGRDHLLPQALEPEGGDGWKFWSIAHPRSATSSCRSSSSSRATRSALLTPLGVGCSHHPACSTSRWSTGW